MSRWRAPLLVTILVLCASADVFRIGFYADDFHFLDIARRIPWHATLLGQYGIYPWYRPLSRELYFEVVSGAGPADLIVAHLLSVACLLGIAWTLFRLGEWLLGPRAAAIAPALLVTYGFTKFLTAWPSGFQDLLATLLVLQGLLAHIRGRLSLTVFCTALAPFAKETGFVAAPLILLYSWVCERRRRIDRSVTGPLLAMLGVVAIHLGVRGSWHGAGTSARSAPSLAELASGLGQALGAFLSAPSAPGVGTVLLGAAAGISASLLMKGESRDPAALLEPPRINRAIVFLCVAAAIGFAPMVAGHLLRLTHPHPYYAYPAIPWFALLLSAALAMIPVSRSIGRRNRGDQRYGPGVSRAGSRFRDRMARWVRSASPIALAALRLRRRSPCWEAEIPA